MLIAAFRGATPLALHTAVARDRCGALTRKRTRCQSAAMRNGRCRMHGGKSTGPRTPEGKERSRMASWKHGRRCRAYTDARREANQAVRLLRQVLAQL
jgi:hypothetical protein